jgi:hypothetical protein
MRHSTSAAVAASPGLDHARLVEANINPLTGLATDYLNHFNEAIMMLELAPQMPDCMDDLRAWRPLSYCEHFALSNFRGRDLAISAYRSADPAVRRRLDELAVAMNALLLSAIRALETAPEALTPAIEDALASLRLLIAHAGAVIHGDASVSAVESEEAQAAVDALLQS